VLNAGIIPEFEKESDYRIINVRFGAYREENKITPVEVLLDKIKLEKHDSWFLDDIIKDKSEAQLWYQLKVLQLEENKKNILIILDQFEELFTYKEREIYEFKKQLAEVLNVVIPQNFQKIIEENQFAGLSAVNEEKLEQLYKPFNVKIVMAIRSDKMSLLNQLKDFLPNILNKTYELTALNSNQAEDAILNPAYKKDEIFESSPFDFTDEALDSILRYLTKGGTQKIESFQLQIICQYAESLAIDHKLKIIDKHALAEINDIFENYYENLIQKLPTAEEQERARVFIEEKLIYEEDKTRLSIYEGQIYKEYNISKDLLKKLVNSHLIRPEPNTAGGFSYELSHDTLVEPILIAKAKRLEKKRIKEMEERAEALRLAELEEQQRIVQRQRLKYTKRLLVAMAVFVIVSIGLTTWAFTASAIAKKQKAKVDQINDDLKAKHKTLDSTNLHLISSRKDLEKSIGQLNDKEDSLQLLLTQVNRQRQKADSAAKSAFQQMILANTAKEETIKANNELKLRIERDSLEDLLTDNALSSDEESWFLDLNNKQRKFVVEQLLNANSNEFENLKKSFLLAAKGKATAKEDIKLALQYIKASIGIKPNDINASILSELGERALYEQKIDGQTDAAEIKNLIYNKESRRVVYTTGSGVFALNVNENSETGKLYGKVDSLLSDEFIVNSAVSDNGQYILLAYADKMQIRDNDGKLIAQDSTKISRYASTIISNNGRNFALSYYGPDGPGIKIYKRDTFNNSTDTFSITFVPTSSEIKVMKFTPDNHNLVYANYRGNVRIVNLEGNEKRIFNPEKSDRESNINALAISSNSQQILSGDNRGNITLWDTSSSSPKKVFKQNLPVLNLEFHPDDKNFIFTHDITLTGEKEEGGINRNLPDTDIFSGNELSYSDVVTYIKLGNTERNNLDSSIGIVTHPSNGLALIFNNKIITTNNGNLFIWGLNSKNVNGISLNELAPLPLEKQIENNLTTIEDLLKSGSKSTLYEAIEYYSKEGEDDHYDKIEKLGTALQSKFLPQLRKEQLVYVKERLANAYDHSIEYDDLDSAIVHGKILKSVVYRKETITQDSSNKEQILKVNGQWELMADNLENEKKYGLALIYRRAIIDLLDSLCLYPCAEDLILDRAKSYFYIAQNYEKLGNYTEALNYYLSRSKILDSAFKRFPKNDTIANTLAVSYSWIGDTYSTLKQYDLAIKYQLEFVKVSALATTLFPKNERITENHATSYRFAASAYNDVKNYAEALKFQFKNVYAMEAAHKTFPKNKSVFERRIYSFYWIAETYEKLKVYDSSLAYYQKYVNTAEEALKQFPEDAHLAGVLLDSYFYLSEGHENLRDYNESLNSLKIRVATAEKFNERFSDNADIANSWAASYQHVASVYDKLKQYHKACAYNQKYIEASKNVYNRFQDNKTSVQNYLRSFYWIAYAYDKIRNYDSALLYRKKGASESEAIIERFPNNDEIIYDCLISNNLIGKGYERKKDYQQSHRYRNDYITVAEHWHKTSPSNVYFLKRLIWSYSEMGSLQIKLNQYDSAAFSFQKFIDTASLYSKEFTGSPGILIDLANVYENLAEISLELGQFQKNIEYLKTANKLIDSVFNFDDIHPSNSVDIYSEMSANYAKLGIANVYLKNYSEAEKLVHEAVKLDPTNSFAQLSLAEWYLVNHKFEAAKKIYLDIKAEPYNEFSYGEYALIRLEKMERAGLIKAQDINIVEIKKYLK
jgi:tetratricopeptide (TPR) repeat protein